LQWPHQEYIIGTTKIFQRKEEPIDQIFHFNF